MLSLLPYFCGAVFLNCQSYKNDYSLETVLSAAVCAHLSGNMSI